jgi:hypothetical protein
MPFVDGEPIDAAKLTALETKLNLIQSKIPTFGGSNTSISVDARTTQTTVSTGPEIQAGEVSGITIESAKITKEVKFDKSFSKKPIVIISMRGGESAHVLAARVLSNSVSATGFKYVISAPSGAYSGTSKATIGINYIAITY